MARILPGTPIPPGTPTGPTGLNDALTVEVGNANHAPTGGDALGDIFAFGYEVFNLNAFGNKGAPFTGVAGTFDDIGGTILMPTLGGNEVVTIGGDTTLLMAVTHSAFGAIQDQTALGTLNVNNLTVTITNTAATEWGQAVAGPMLFATDAGANGGVHAPVISYSNNAVRIDASASGGLIDPWGDANFIPASYRRGEPGRHLHRRHDPSGSGDGCWWPCSRQRHRRFDR